MLFRVKHPSRSRLLPGDVTVVIYEPSVVQVHAQASAVARYVREGNDLLIYMQDGTRIRCNGYFLQAANTAEESNWCLPMVNS
ncbi:BapA prefix-like domain-containing protein [Escherichia coli]